MATAAPLPVAVASQTSLSAITSSTLQWGLFPCLLGLLAQTSDLSQGGPLPSPTCPLAHSFHLTLRWLCGIRGSAASCRPVWHPMPDVLGKGQLTYTPAIMLSSNPTASPSPKSTWLPACMGT